MANVPAGGDLMVARYEDGVINGDAGDLPVNRGVNMPAIGSYPGFSLTDIDATQRMGPVDGTQSDPMFERFNRKDQENQPSESPDPIGSVGLAGADSDPPFKNDAGDMVDSDDRA